MGEVRRRGGGSGGTAAATTKPIKNNPKKNRRGKKDAEGGVGHDSVRKKGPPEAKAEKEKEKEETLWQTFTSHPLVNVGRFILVPYALYWGFHYVRLQRPDLASAATLGLVRLRPAVGVEGERQVLIVAPMSGGTVQVAHDLGEKLGLEVGHECSNTAWHYARDGTVSWMHGLRFLDPPDTRDGMAKSLTKLCDNFTEAMGFHPDMYRPSQGKCSHRRRWDQCWRDECRNVVVREWGCARTGRCETPYRRVLHQVRHPLRTVESLASKFCVGGIHGAVHPSLLTYASALFWEVDFKRDDSCAVTAAKFVLGYSEAMRGARRDGLIDGRYKVEEASPCDVARLAGLLSEEDAVYPPNRRRARSVCNEPSGSGGDALRPMTSSEHRINVGLVKLDWKDLRDDDGNDVLERALWELTRDLGYDPEGK